VLGFNKSGKEVARIQVEQPIYIRPANGAPGSDTELTLIGLGRSSARSKWFEG